MFDEIEKAKKELPNVSVVKKKIFNSKKQNFYQIVAIILFIVGSFMSILLGNMVPSCTDTNVFGQCQATEFNISLTLLSLAICFLLSMFFYSIGHIINVLEAIEHKMQ